MKTKVVLLTALLTLACSHANAQSQMELNGSAARDCDAAKKKATKAARDIASKNNKVKGLKTKLDEAEELYNNFVEGHIRTIFPIAKNQDNQMTYGSANPMCRSQIGAQMWMKRAKELVDWNQTPTKLAPTKNGLATTKADYLKADKKLNDMYIKVKKSPARSGETGPQFLKELVSAEVAWIAFRNTDSEAFGMSNGNSEESKYAKMIELTNDRTNQLNEWVKGIEEGNVCGGSRPVR